MILILFIYIIVAAEVRDAVLAREVARLRELAGAESGPAGAESGPAGNENEPAAVTENEPAAVTESEPAVNNEDAEIDIEFSMEDPLLLDDSNNQIVFPPTPTSTPVPRQ